MEKLSLEEQLHRAAIQGDASRIYEIVMGEKLNVDCSDKENTTPLMFAAANSHLDCVEELLNLGADTVARRHTGATALFFAAQGGYLDIIQELLKKNQSIVDLPNYEGATPLIVACQCNHLEAATLLIDNGADVHVQMSDGATALFLAAQNGHCRIIELLQKHEASVNEQRKDKASPLWIACQMGHLEVVKLLLRLGAEVDAAREDGATPLFKATHKGHLEIVKELIKHKANLNLLPIGESALHAAALFGHGKIVKELYESGCDPQLKNAFEQTPADLAKDAGYEAIYNYLQNPSSSVI